MVHYDDQLISSPPRLQHYAKENHWNQTTERRIIINIGEPLLFLAVVNNAAVFKNNRLNEWDVHNGMNYFKGKVVGRETYKIRALESSPGFRNRWIIKQLEFSSDIAWLLAMHNVQSRTNSSSWKHFETRKYFNDMNLIMVITTTSLHNIMPCPFL